MSTAKMKNVTSLSKSATASDAPTWLKEKVYGPKRQRTVQLVKLSVDTLRQGGNRVSLASVTTKSKDLDPEGVEFQRARFSIMMRRTPTTNSTVPGTVPTANPRGKARRLVPVKAERDVARARSRYFKMRKQNLVERLLATEQAYARQYELWLQLNEQLISFQLPAKVIQR